MQISYTNDAYASLVSLVDFIEAKNTQGAGIRWLNRFEEFLTKSMILHLHIPFCKNETFRRLNLKCIQYNDWVIAFSETNEQITLEAILHISRISD